MDRGNRNDKRSMFRDSRHQRKGSPLLMVLMILLLFGVLYILTIDISDSGIVRWMLGDKAEQQAVDYPEKQLAIGFSGDLILAYTADSCQLQYVSSKMVESNISDLQERLKLDANGRWNVATDACEYSLEFAPYEAIYWKEYVDNLGNWMLQCDSIYFTFGAFEEANRKKMYVANLCMSEDDKAMGIVLDTIGNRAFFELALNIKELEQRTKRSFFMDILTIDDGPQIKQELERLNWNYSEDARADRIRALESLNNTTEKE